MFLNKAVLFVQKKNTCLIQEGGLKNGQQILFY